jgi:endonuclease-3
MAEEPAENISGGADGGGVDAEFATGTPDTRAEAVVDALGDSYWRTAYGGRDAFPCLVRTILSQNTSDTASQPAFDDLLDRYDDGNDLAAALAAADRETLADTIASAGLYNQKWSTQYSTLLYDFGG